MAINTLLGIEFNEDYAERMYFTNWKHWDAQIMSNDGELFDWDNDLIALVRSYMPPMCYNWDLMELPTLQETLIYVRKDGLLTLVAVVHKLKARKDWGDTVPAV